MSDSLLPSEFKALVTRAARGTSPKQTKAARRLASALHEVRPVLHNQHIMLTALDREYITRKWVLFEDTVGNAVLKRDDHPILFVVLADHIETADMLLANDVPCEELFSSLMEVLNQLADRAEGGE